jgi:hypothetical protein
LRGSRRSDPGDDRRNHWILTAYLRAAAGSRAGVTIERVADLESDFDAVVAASESANSTTSTIPGSTVGFRRAGALLDRARGHLAELDAAANASPTDLRRLRSVRETAADRLQAAHDAGVRRLCGTS